MLKRSIMTLYSGPLDIYSHQVRVVLAEKGVHVDIVSVDSNHPREELAELNPYNTLPTLVDRELVLFNPHIIMEYLDERFPHPPLLPVYPVARAICRLLMYRIERDLYYQMKTIEEGIPKQVEANRDALKKDLIAMDPIFAEKPYFMSDDFILVDCVMAPLLWRLPYVGVNLSRTSAKAIFNYKKRLFERASFRASLSEAERELRETHDA
ncbi:glutathione S-transferase N-terminal domain-containing protein [Coxiella endosymbiont of Amblyomma nuttalli]|uniref:glutathione S-transferase N-terminal domain-containing protein n=1 Tax=Coxiella endosymbiont of Amblyomma nuttalli TaxID=2749996 RepID=UPI001BA7AEB9|nr:glutathione S-transferase N-terminal domain-containing protein [Coxiella endosymbiont of Amblyomma nuttalli]QTS84171.1 Stringent starvation protein A [Coxiella endosymbiont of Amblyomma nuttalli]